MSATTPTTEEAFGAARRLVEVASVPTRAAITGQSRKVANFLLAWWNASRDGGWDPTDLWNVDEEIRRDMLIVLRWLAESHCYIDKFGLREQMVAMHGIYRGRTS
jgi:hypothetical protein